MKTLHQLLFDDNRTGGVGLIDSTFRSDVDAMLGWEKELKHFYRLSDEVASPPDQAFSYLRFGPDAAVLRRVNTGAQTGRNFSQAIVGPADELNGLAFPLTRWRGWLPPEKRGQVLEPSDASSLQKVCQRYEQDMRTQPLVAQYAVRALLAAIFANPEMDMSVLGVSSDAAADVLFAVRDIVRVIGGGPVREWTFSTFETSDRPRAHLPEFVFMPRLPEKLDIDDRHRLRIDVAGTLPWPSFVRLAGVLYQEYRNHSWETFQKRTRQAAGHADLFADRVHRLFEKRMGAAAAYVPPSLPRAAVAEPTVTGPEVVEPDVVELTADPAGPDDFELTPVRAEPPLALHKADLFQPIVQPVVTHQVPSPPPAEFEELLSVRSARELARTLDRISPDLSLSQRRKLWEQWRTRVLRDVVGHDASIALRVRTFEKVLVLLVDNGPVSPKEIIAWLSEMNVIEVFYQQVGERTNGAAPRRPSHGKPFLTWSDLPIVAFTAVILVAGVLFGLWLVRL